MLIQKYNNINLSLAAYNAGSGNVDGWIEKGTLKSDGSDIENVPNKTTMHPNTTSNRFFDLINSCLTIR